MEDLIFTAYLVKGHKHHRFIFAINKDNLDEKLLEDEIPVYYVHYFNTSLSGYLYLLIDYLGFEETCTLICTIMDTGFYNARSQYRDIHSDALQEIDLPFPLDAEITKKISLALDKEEINELVSECLYFGIKPIRELSEQIVFNYSFN